MTVAASKAVASYTVKVDECDIAKDLGISKSATIDSAYIDGVKTNVTNASVTSDRNGKIDALNTTSLVGAQGRLTEVYKMENGGYRLVEINTYLAHVDKVTATTTDRNGHTTNATVDLTVYLTNSTGVKFTKVEAEGFTVDQYVLVTVLNPEDYNAIAAKNKASVESVEAATVTPMGQLKTWTYAYGTTAATTTVAATTYNDADKFYVGNIKSASNDSYDTIVTAPTCGACGVLPAVLKYVQDTKNLTDAQICRGLATAGIIGNLTKSNASISGAEVGCQGEVGVACAMAAAAASQLFGGTPAQIEYSAEMGLEHHLGLTCDPVCGLVQIPCIERNAYAAARALDANLYAAISDGQHSVSFDRIVEVMKQTGHDLPSIYKETAKGGLAAIQ